MRQARPDIERVKQSIVRTLPSRDRRRGRPILAAEVSILLQWDKGAVTIE
jgi:hypothetical protein